MRPLGRLMTAMVTPFTAEDTVDHAQLAELTRRLIAEGSDGLVVTGTTGEAPTLSPTEKVAVWQTVVAAAGATPVIAGVGTNDTAASIELAKQAEAVGCEGLLAVNPYYNKPNQAGLFQHFQAIAVSTSLPLILYNHPPRTGVCIEPETLARLAELPNVVGIKDSSCSLELVSQYRRVTPEPFRIWSGDDLLTLPILSVGGHGVISVTSHVAGQAIRQMLIAWERGDVATARRLHLDLLPLHKALFMAPSPAPTKAALALLGFPVGGVRLPLTAADAALQTLLKDLLVPWRHEALAAL
ncbi:MAG: 4-hydroxy-tetrahydrodipicolinate synthase [Candidatus Sericytochromatia bacterium]|nr:4-hydroxy-tetrahydrodipicolinate synthase [Candidatus Sericytochromatia bacterium]